jgi:hypothetical protein
MRVVGWPFPVSVRGDVTAGGPCTLTVEWRTEPDQKEQVDRVRCVVAWWVRLAAEGGLGGQHIAPAQGRGQLASDAQPDEFPGAMRWSLTALRVDPRALTIVLNLLLVSALPVVRVTVACDGADLEVVLTPREQPGRWPAPPFVLDEDRVTRDVTIEVELASELVEPARSALVELLQVWSLVGALGGFREIVPVSDASELVPEDEVGVDIDLVTLVVRDKNAHEVAYDVLVNLLTRAAVAIAPIVRVSLR